MDQKEAVDEVFRRAGSVAELARRIGAERRAVQHWKQNRRIPLEWVPAVSKATDVPRFYLAPKLYE